MAKNADSITLGIGDLTIDGVDVGYLAGSVVFSADIETEDWKSGVPLVLRERTVKSFDASLKASLAQLDMSALGKALGIGSISGTRLKLGTSWTLATLSNVKFVHVRDDGRKVKIFFPKAKIKPDKFTLTFSGSEFVTQDITITPIYDSTASEYPLGYIDIQDIQQEA